MPGLTAIEANGNVFRVVADGKITAETVFGNLKYDMTTGVAVLTANANVDTVGLSGDISRDVKLHLQDAATFNLSITVRRDPTFDIHSRPDPHHHPARPQPRPS